jgi:hypothetical protein
VVNSDKGTVQVEEIIDETTFADYTEEQKQELADICQDFEIRIKLDLRDPKGISHQVLFSSKKDLITLWANNLKKLHYLGMYDKPLNTISTYIKREIGKIDKDLDSKSISYHYVDEILDEEFKLETKPRKDAEKLLLNTSETRELTEEEKFTVDTLNSLHLFFKWMSDITVTMRDHLNKPEINNDMQPYFDEYSKIAALRDPIEFMLGEGSILNQIEDEQNIRESATIYQMAICKAMEATLSYRQMAQFFAVSPRQNQRIRNRLDEWPDKKPETVITKNILSYCCQNCGMNTITGKKYNKNGDVTGEVKLGHKKYPIPKQFIGKPITPIHIALEVAKEIEKKTK